jgi:ABC-type branched-subunit amino acid transport system substrate-binding protein
MAELSPIRIGILSDIPGAGGAGGFEDFLQRGIDEVAASGRIDRPVEFVKRQAYGLPAGTEHSVVEAWHELVAEGVVLILGPAVSDNGYLCAPLADETKVPAINWTGGELTRSEWMFHYQIGSLEEEPSVLAARIAERGLRTVAVVHDQATIGLRYLEGFDDAVGLVGLEVLGRAGIAPVAGSDQVVASLRRLRATQPDALVYLGLGLASRAVALAQTELDWHPPTFANSALMFAYMYPEWRDGFAGWEYCDGISDDNAVRRSLMEGEDAGAAVMIGGAYDLGRLVGEAIARARHLTRAGLKEGLERIKRVPAAMGVDGTWMGFGLWDRAALKGEFLVLRRWEDGRSVQVERARPR